MEIKALLLPNMSVVASPRTRVSGSSYTATNSDWIIECSATGGITIILPDSGSAIPPPDGKRYIIKDQIGLASGHPITIQSFSGMAMESPINGTRSLNNIILVIDQAFASVEVYFNYNLSIYSIMNVGDITLPPSPPSPPADATWNTALTVGATTCLSSLNVKVTVTTTSLGTYCQLFFPYFSFDLGSAVTGALITGTLPLAYRPNSA